MQDMAFFKVWSVCKDCIACAGRTDGAPPFPISKPAMLHISFFRYFKQNAVRSRMAPHRALDAFQNYDSHMMERVCSSRYWRV